LLYCKLYNEPRGDNDTEHFHHSPSEKQLADLPIRVFVDTEKFELYIFIGVQRFKGSRFHSRPQTPFRMPIYEKSVIFVRPNPKCGAKLAITWENEHF